MSIRVSIVEDNLLLRDSLSKLINVSEGFLCVSSHVNAELARAKLPCVKPEVILMDIIHQAVPAARQAANGLVG